MTTIKRQQMVGLFFIFSLFFLSNISAFINIIWLIPPLVIFETFIWLLLAVTASFLLWKNNLYPIFIENLKRNWIILPFLIYTGLSIFWSIAWAISFYRWLILVFTFIAGAYLGLRYNLREFVNFLTGFGILILLMSSILVFFVPSIGVMNYHIIQGAWKGIFWHKNHMGLFASFVNLLFLINLVEFSLVKGKGRIFFGILYLYSLFFIYQTDSVAAYFTTISIHGLIFLILIWRKFRRKIRSVHYLYFILILILITLFIFPNLDLVFGIFNRNTTLTGRMPMWAYLFETYLAKQPAFGYGINAFWYLSSHRIDMQLAASYPDQIVIADNGFIDILINTGYVGLILFSFMFLWIFGHSVRFAVKTQTISGFFPLVLMAFVLIANVSWSLIFENESFFMLLMICVLFNVSKRAGESTLAAA